jgi:uncharacterized membrane protein YgaE (UPF0421/DUF939 family)
MGMVALLLRSPRTAAAVARHRMHGRTWPIVQTAAAAVVAWYLAVLLLGGDRPLFAPIAAVIALGATHNQNGQRAFELVGGVILGLAVGDLLVHAIGTGPWQAGVMVVLAMGAAVALGGRELLVSEAAVSAILIATIPSTGGQRVLEGMLGGGVALITSVLLFPPDPALQVARALNGVFATLGRALGDVARALEHGDADAAERALRDARAVDDELLAVQRELTELRETTRYAPRGRRSRGQVSRFERSLPQLDFAVRDTRGLARNAARFLRAGATAPPELTESVRALADAVWELAGAFEEAEREAEVRRVALGAAGRVTALGERTPDLRMAEVVVQVRSLAIDLVRAAEVAARESEPPSERPTDELLTA